MENGYQPEPVEAALEDKRHDALEHGDLRSEEGAAGYILLWLMGVPAGLLFVVFLLRGCN